MAESEPQIQSITVARDHRLKLIVQTEQPRPDLTANGRVTQDYDTDTIYSLFDQDYDGIAPSGRERPMVLTKDKQLCFWVTVKGIGPELSGRPLALRTGTKHSNFFFESETLVPPEIAANTTTNCTFKVFDHREQGTHPSLPAVFYGQLKFTLYHADEHVHGQDPNDLLNGGGKVNVEIYILSNPIPEYFEGRMPLLFVRMFALAAHATNITTQEEWIALVVKICHGSVTPFHGEETETEDHWLRYDCQGGNSSFVIGGGPGQIPNKRFMNYGGHFLLSAWLNAWRNGNVLDDHLRVVTLVNCYDQAAAVEVALSLGIDYNNVAWEYHQKYGFIPDGTKLVGWGECNSPYFKFNEKWKTVDAKDSKRTYFRNHAFLSWSPDFHPEKIPEFFETYPNSSTYPQVQMRAIDACAGPHLGDEPLGVWVDPSELPDGYADKSTYWKSRDTVYDHEKFNSDKYLRDYGFKNYNSWTPGITSFRADKIKDSRILHLGPDVFERNNVTFPDPLQESGMIGVKLVELQATFWAYLESVHAVEQSWMSTRIPDVDLPDKYLQREFKRYAPAEEAKKRLRYISFRATVASSIHDAVCVAQTRAAQSSSYHEAKLQVRTEKDAKYSRSGQRTVYQITTRCSRILLCLNLVVEISAAVGKDIPDEAAEKIYQEILRLATVEEGKWKEFLS